MKQKIANFWYYYKWYVLSGVLLLAALAGAINSCRVRVKPDLYVMYALDTVPNAVQLQELEQWFSGMTTDENGDGETTATILATATVDQWNGGNSSAMLVQVNAGNAVLYLLNSETYEILHNNGVLQQLDFPEGESAYIEGDRYRLSASGELSVLESFSGADQEVYLCIRRVAGTTFEGKEKYLTQERLAKELLQKLVSAEK